MNTDQPTQTNFSHLRGGDLKLKGRCGWRVLPNSILLSMSCFFLGCQLTQDRVASNPFQEPNVVVAEHEQEPPVDELQPPTATESINAADAQPVRKKPGIVRIKSEPEANPLSPAHYEASGDPAANTVQQISLAQANTDEITPTGGLRHHHRRSQAPCPPTPEKCPVCPPNGTACPHVVSGAPVVGTPVAPFVAGTMTLPEPPQHYEDEYLCDGGDRDYPVHYEGINRAGLDTEDTVAEYMDHTGEKHVKPTNKVCVYAPRFGSVRTVSAPVVSDRVDRIAGATEVVQGSSFTTQLAPTGRQKVDQTIIARMRSRASGLNTEDELGSIAQLTYLGGHTKWVNAFQEFGFTSLRQFEDLDAVEIAARLDAALTWSREDSPYVAATTSAGNEVYASFREGVYTGVEDMKTKGRLEIVKSVDKTSASVGDIVTFTLLFKNTGDRELLDIRLIDNLTPRLEYIEGSAKSDRPSVLKVTDNGEGSVVLKWLFQGTLPGHEQGMVTFQARVR